MGEPGPHTLIARGATGESREPADSVATIVADDETALAQVCGLTVLERNLRALAQAGVREATVVSARRNVLEVATARHWSRASLAVRTAGRAALTEAAPSLTFSELSALTGGRGVLYVPASILCDTRLFQALLAARDSAVLVDSEPPETLRALVASAARTSRGLVCGPCRLEPAFLASHAAAGSVDQALPAAIEDGRVQPIDVASQPSYVPSMRRAVRPLWFPAPGPAERRAAESALFDSAQKHVLDLPAIVHAPIETAVVARLCRTPITPNQLTVSAAAVAWTATLLFARGHLGAGLAVALAVGVLDGLDGKQARVKLECSRLGELEHVSDFAFELSWWAALAWHFLAAGALPWSPLIVLALYLAEGVDGLVKLAAIEKLGRMIDDAAPSMRLLRLVGGRRNVYVWIMAAGWIAGDPVAAFVLLPFWEGATAVLHLAWALPRLAGWQRASAPEPGGR